MLRWFSWWVFATLVGCCWLDLFVCLLLKVSVLCYYVGCLFLFTWVLVWVFVVVIICWFVGLLVLLFWIGLGGTFGLFLVIVVLLVWCWISLLVVCYVNSVVILQFCTCYCWFLWFGRLWFFIVVLLFCWFTVVFGFGWWFWLLVLWVWFYVFYCVYV